jgi:hypothetical protein
VVRADQLSTKQQHFVDCDHTKLLFKLARVMSSSSRRSYGSSSSVGGPDVSLQARYDPIMVTVIEWYVDYETQKDVHGYTDGDFRKPYTVSESRYS